MLIAAECEAHEGMHVPMENIIVEIVVREGGEVRPAREGEVGEVVFTDLHNLGMPFIRYANGDLATQGPARRCSCGRSLSRLEAVEGRTSELLRDGLGASVSGLSVSFLVQDVSAVRQFQAVQHVRPLCNDQPRGERAYTALGPRQGRRERGPPPPRG